MTDIVLHIGLNKTGTSSIQDFMSMNAGLLLEEGICYPKTGRDRTAHHNFSRWIKAQLAQKSAPQVDEGQALLKEIAGAKLAVLSSEDFHTLANRGVELMAELLKGHKVKVVLYVREHVAYLASWYQQNVQATHLSCSFDTFCYFNRKPLHQIADRWAESFGRKNVTVRVYDRASLTGGDVVLDFVGQFGLKGDLSRFKRKPFESNPSVTGNLLFAKRLVNNFCTKAQAAEYVEEVGSLARLKPSFGGHMQVSAQEVDHLSGLYKPDRLRLFQRYGAKIEPLEGLRRGQPVPDFETLSADWALIMQTAAERQFGFAAAARYISLGDFSGMGPSPA